MALVVEDGTIVTEPSPAESYLSVADADQIVSNLGLSDEWSTFTTTEKEAYLRRGTIAFDELGEFQSYLLEPATQPLLWPREPFYDKQGRLVTGIPQGVKRLTVELAVAISKGITSDESVTIASQSFGDSSETYATPIREGDTTYVNIVKSARKLGYLRSGASFVEIQRA